MRRRSASPHCKQSVDFWEAKQAESRRGRSQERKQAREKSISPQCRQSVQHWEDQTRRDSSQDRAEDKENQQVNMPEKKEIKVQGGGIMDRLDF